MRQVRYLPCGGPGERQQRMGGEAVVVVGVTESGMRVDEDEDEDEQRAI
jgi:hypothetical protein